MSLTPKRLAALRFIVCEHIRTGEWPVAKTVAAEFGINRSSMHATIHTLEREGYVAIDPIRSARRPIRSTDKGERTVLGPDDWFTRIMEGLHVRP